MTEAVSSARDRTPPVLVDFSMEGPDRMVIIFDEPVSVDEATLRREPSGAIEATPCEDGTLSLRFLPPCEPGSENSLYMDIFDDRGNTNWFLLDFYGPNENQPPVVINEISPNGSSSRPDMVEFFVLSGGNTAGMALFLGTEKDNKSRYVFPCMDVAEGEYIIFHCRPQGGEGEISETGGDLELSTGLRSEPGVRDLWPDEDMNLPGTSGVLSLMTLPLKGETVDRVIYTNRTGDDSDKYKGWTSTLWPQIEELSALSPEIRGWVAEGELLFPEDAVSSVGTTSTRTLCRSSLSGDEDRREDWHTAPTGGCSFGYPNTDDEYVP